MLPSDLAFQSLGYQENICKFEAKRLTENLDQEALTVIAMLYECFMELCSIEQSDMNRLSELKRRVEYLLDQFSSKIEEIQSVVDRLLELKAIT